MTEADQELEAYAEAFDIFLDKFTGKHEDSWIKQTLYPDTVQVRKDLIVKAFRWPAPIGWSGFSLSA